VLAGIEMPGTSGLEAIPKIRALSPRTQVIMLTVFADEDRIAEAIGAGASGYLLKTSSLDRIFEAIREVASGERP
jgi:DNA-binding NarL/FixJ family response regulator